MPSSECLRRNIVNWSAIGASDTIKYWLQHGISLPFKSGLVPKQYFEQNTYISRTDAEFLDAQIASLKSQGVIRECSRSEIHCLSPLKCIAKKDGSRRLLVNLHSLNTYIETPKFRYEGINLVSELIQTGDRLYSADLKDGFFHVPVAKAFQKYLGVSWRDKFYVWCVLPQGLACSPYFFYKILRPVLQYLREQGLRLTLYVDDFLLMCKPRDSLDHKDLLLDTLRDLGWHINYEKSDLSDTTSCSYIGYHISSVGPDGLPWITINSKRVAKLRKDLKRCLSHQYITVRRLARVAGQCISMIKAVLPGKLLLQNIYRFIAHRESWDNLVALTAGVKEELLWWLEALSSWNGAPLRVRTVDCQLATDASSTGWGACMGTLEASGVWTAWVTHMPSNYRELLAVVQALKSFGPKINNMCIQILSDNITTVACINKLYSPSSALGQLAQSLWVVANQLNVELRAKYLAGHLNTHADALSRIISPYEWKLSRHIFVKLDRLWGPHTIDRCASLTTAQLPLYNSLFHDPSSAGVDCLAQQDWSHHNNFVNPPFWMLPQLLEVIQRQKADATLIAPLWPAQPWMQTILTMLIDWPVPIPNTNRTIQGFLTTPEPRKNPRWQMFAWRISGRAS